MTATGEKSGGRGKVIALWGVRLLLAAAFIAAGGAKLAGVPMLVEEFERIGLGQWFRYLTGTLEILGGLAVLATLISGLGALLLCCIMIGALIAHGFVIGGNPVPAIILLLLAALVAWAQRRQTASLLGLNG